MIVPLKPMRQAETLQRGFTEVELVTPHLDREPRQQQLMRCGSWPFRWPALCHDSLGGAFEHVVGQVARDTGAGRDHDPVEGGTCDPVGVSAFLLACAASAAIAHEAIIDHSPAGSLLRSAEVVLAGLR